MWPRSSMPSMYTLHTPLPGIPKYFPQLNTAIGDALPHYLPEMSSVRGLRWMSEVNTAVELAGDQDSSSSRYPAECLLSEQSVWHPCYAPVDLLLGSGSDTALLWSTYNFDPWLRILYRRLKRRTQGKMMEGLDVFPGFGIQIRFWKI